MNPTSPVRSSPPGSVCCVASGRFQYPGTTMGPLVTISPISPGGRSLPSSSTIRTTVLKTGTPTDSAPLAGSTGARRPNGTACDGEVVSVSP